MSTTEGEHTFEEDLLISGEELRGYTAAEDLTRGEPVAVSGDYEVSASSDGGNFIGVVMYDVVQGDEVVIAGDDCEVRGLTVSEAISAGDALVPDGSGGFRQAVASTPETGQVLAQTGASSGNDVEGYIFAVAGTRA